jgi:plasmid stabilization system protein ParE
LTLPVILSVEARADFDTTIAWYERQRAGLGERYAARVQDTLDQISERPELYAPIAANVRRARIRTFPYLIYYRVEPELIAVLAIVHGSRDPRLWHARL